MKSMLDSASLANLSLRITDFENYSLFSKTAGSVNRIKKTVAYPLVIQILDRSILYVKFSQQT